MKSQEKFKMTGRPKTEEQYIKDHDVINFVIYDSTTGVGEDEVPQHKIMGTTETAHITLHPDGTVNFRVTTERLLKNSIELIYLSIVLIFK